MPVNVMEITENEQVRMPEKGDPDLTSSKVPNYLSLQPIMIDCKNHENNEWVKNTILRAVNQLQNAKASRSVFEDKWEKRIKAYEMRDQDDGYRQPLAHFIMSTLVSAQLKMLKESSPLNVTEPVLPIYSDNAKVIEKVIDWEYDNLGHNTRRNIFLQAGVVGTVFVMPVWDSEKQQNEFQIYNAQDVWLDPYIPDIRKQKFVITLSRPTLGELKRLSRSNVYQNIDQIEQFYSGYGDLNEFVSHDEDEKSAIVNYHEMTDATPIEIYNVFTKLEFPIIDEEGKEQKIEKYAIITFEPRSYIPLRIVENTYPGGICQLVPFTIDRPVNSRALYGSGNIEWVIDLVKNYSEHHKYLMKNLAISSMPMYKYKKWTGYDPDDLIFDAGNQIPVTEHDDIMPLEHPRPVSAELVKTNEVLRDLVERDTGATQVQQGQLPDREQKATIAKIAKQSADSRASDTIGQLGDDPNSGFRLLSEYIWLNNLYFLPEDSQKWIQITGDKGKQWLSIKKDQLQGKYKFKNRLTAVDRTLGNEWKAMHLVRWLGIFSKIPPNVSKFVPDFQYLAKRYLELANLEDDAVKLIKGVNENMFNQPNMPVGGGMPQGPGGGMPQGQPGRQISPEMMALLMRFLQGPRSGGAMPQGQGMTPSNPILNRPPIGLGAAPQPATGGILNRPRL